MGGAAGGVRLQTMFFAACGNNPAIRKQQPCVISQMLICPSRYSRDLPVAMHPPGASSASSSTRFRTDVPAALRRLRRRALCSTRIPPGGWAPPRSEEEPVSATREVCCCQGLPGIHAGARITRRERPGSPRATSTKAIAWGITAATSALPQLGAGLEACWLPPWLLSPFLRKACLRSRPCCGSAAAAPVKGDHPRRCRCLPGVCNAAHRRRSIDRHREELERQGSAASCEVPTAAAAVLHAAFQHRTCSCQPCTHRGCDSAALAAAWPAACRVGGPPAAAAGCRGAAACAVQLS